MWLLSCRDVWLSTQESLPDDVDDFEEFRTRSSELVRDVVFIVGASDVFCQVTSFSVIKLNNG